MTAFLVLAALLLALIAATIVAAVRGSSSRIEPAARDRSERQRDLLDQLGELEFEYQTGKIGDEEYREIKAPLARAALAVRADLEASTGSNDRPDTTDVTK